MNSSRGIGPFRPKGSSPHKLAQLICSEDPSRPSTQVAQSETIEHTDGFSQTLTPDVVSRARSTEPDRLQRQLSGDLDAIILTALTQRTQPALRLG